MAEVTVSSSDAKSVVSCEESCPAAELFVRRVLRAPVDRRPSATEDQAHRVFSVSILLSAARCLLSYIVLPIVTPLLGAATRVGPVVGIPIAVVALYFDVKGIRRFWLANHRWRWYMTALYLGVIALVLGLLVVDVVQLA